MYYNVYVHKVFSTVFHWQYTKTTLSLVKFFVNNLHMIYGRTGDDVQS